MLEKRKPPLSFLFCLISFTLCLTLSSLLLLQSDDYSFLSGSVFDLILVNNTPISFKPDVKHEQVKPPFVSTMASPVYVSNVLRTPLVQHKNSSCSEKLEASREKESKELDLSRTTLRVYMYDLPSEFHFGLLGWKEPAGHVWPNVSDPSQIPPYPGGLNLQHSIEYWLTIDLLLSNVPNVERPCTAIRVMNSSEADVVFVPFFSSLSYNRHSKVRGREKVSVNKVLQDKLVEFLIQSDEWKRTGGKDHLIVAHHPNSMLTARRKLGSAIFVLADFGRYPAEIANLKKDVIAPYRHLVRTVASDSSAPFDRRPILAYFQGAIYRKDKGAIRQELYYLMKDEEDVHFAFGNVQGHGISKAGQGMALAKFCLNIAGDTPSSNRLFDAIASHCVPVIISDEIELPFEDVLDYSEFCIFVKASDAMKKGFLLNLLRGIGQNKWTQMWNRLKEVEHHFEYRFPSQPGDAVDMIWQAVLRKRPSLQSKSHRMNRFRRSQRLLKSQLKIGKNPIQQ